MYYTIYRVLSRNEFFFFGGGGKMVRGKCTLGRGLGPSPRKVLVCLYSSTSIHLCLLAGKSFLNAIILNCNWKNFWGEAGVFGGEASPPSWLNPDNAAILCLFPIQMGAAVKIASKPSMPWAMFLKDQQATKGTVEEHEKYFQAGRPECHFYSTSHGTPVAFQGVQAMKRFRKRSLCQCLTPGWLGQIVCTRRYLIIVDWSCCLYLKNLRSPPVDRNSEPTKWDKSQCSCHGFCRRKQRYHQQDVDTVRLYGV